MTQRVRLPLLLAWLLAPLLAVPVFAWALMEYGPERSFVFAVYPLLWGIVFLVAGLLVARAQPAATLGAVLTRAAAWATAVVTAAIAALFTISFMLVP